MASAAVQAACHAEVVDQEGPQVDMAEAEEIMDADRMTTAMRNIKMVVAAVATTTMARIVAEVQGATAEAAILLVVTILAEAAMARAITTGKAEEVIIEVIVEVEVMTMTTGTKTFLDRGALSEAEATIATAITITIIITTQATEEATSDQREVVVQWEAIIIIDRHLVAEVE
jgi:hypothetical protein